MEDLFDSLTKFFPFILIKLVFFPVTKTIDLVNWIENAFVPFLTTIASLFNDFFKVLHL